MSSGGRLWGGGGRGFAVALSGLLLGTHLAALLVGCPRPGCGGLRRRPSLPDPGHEPAAIHRGSPADSTGLI